MQRKDPIPITPSIVKDATYAKILEKLSIKDAKPTKVADVENHDMKDPPSTMQDQGTSKGVKQSVIEEHVTTLPHGIQTTMNVEMISPNHLRFVDEPRPPDLGVKGTANKISMAHDDMHEEVIVGAMQEDSEMVAETQPSNC
ncbi:S-layer-like proteiny domain-containing protein [Sesbania bispinosa]|nr:S-layer-like proteiny domain-containing protein [Sesbania bispinosa]